MIVPFIDIFAGPGGLGEGFARFSSFGGTGLAFKSRLSVEMDPVAARTLALRAFTHEFPADDLPDDYYRFVRGDIALDDLPKGPEWEAALSRVWNAELGKVDVAELHSRIRSSLDGAEDWVLLGGPPCQAYSLAGRSRMTGLGSLADQNEDDEELLQKLGKERLDKFYNDHRHQLYREYLRIVAVHQPSVFVMENVKGILSSRIPDPEHPGEFKRVFSQIRADLSDPWSALEGDVLFEELDGYRQGPKHRYRLFSFTVSEGDRPDGFKDTDFLIRSETYGVPQARHRVILLGIREDLVRTPDTLVPSGTVRVEDVISGFPRLRSGVSKGADSRQRWLDALAGPLTQSAQEHLRRIGVLGRYQAVASRSDVNLGRGNVFRSADDLAVETSASLSRWLLDARIKGVLQHETRAHQESDLRRYLFAAVATEKLGRTPKLDAWPSDLLPEHRNVSVSADGTNVVRGFGDRFRVQAWEAPATTITSHISKDGHYFIHPDPEQCRSLTVREAARLQTFPDNYFFAGNRTQQYHQVGNAVPPYLALQLAGIVAKLLE